MISPPLSTAFQRSRDCLIYSDSVCRNGRDSEFVRDVLGDKLTLTIADRMAFTILSAAA